MTHKHDFYPYVVNRAPVGIYILSQDKFEFLNPECERIFGFTIDELQKSGLEFIKYVHPDDRSFLAERRQARKEGKDIASTYQLRIIDKAELHRTLEFDTTPVPGHKDLVLGIVRDITQQKLNEEKLRESEQRFKGLVERASEGIVIIQDGLIRYANPYMEEICGYNNEEFLGEPFHKFVATDSVEMVLDRHKRRNLGESVITCYETVLRNKYSKKVHVDITINEFICEGKTTYLTVIHDITKHKEVEDQLRTTLKKLRHAMNGTIQAISMILETRDPYTAGHQRRVSDLARSIAVDMGLSAEQIDAIRIAGILHDIGKIAVPAEILTKPTSLTPAEFELIKSHSRVAYDILKTVDFPWAIAEIVHQHHERLNGSGYPQGLKGDQILIEAKILAIADVTEAMVSDRPYRAARSLEVALNELSQCRGILFDPKAIDICIKLFKEKGFNFHKKVDNRHTT